jgi:hypothetical protein
MIIDNFHVFWTRRLLGPLETNPPLIVDTNAVLPLSMQYPSMRPPPPNGPAKNKGIKSQEQFVRG